VSKKGEREKEKEEKKGGEAVLEHLFRCRDGEIQLLQWRAGAGKV
jgi:hypothetical protein